MDNTERIALLRKVAEVAPKEMEARFMPSAMCAYFLVPLAEGKSYPVALGLNGDVADARPIIAMLDAMEMAGHGVLLTRQTVKGLYECEVYLDDSAEPEGRVRGLGPTRAIAVARAFVRVFGGD